MARKYTHDFYRMNEDGSETLVTVEFTQTPFIPARISGPPEDCYPAEGGEVDIQRAWTEADGWNAKYSDTEEEKWTEWLQENPAEDSDPSDW